MSDEYAEIDYDNCEFNTEKASLLVIEDRKVWVPHSVIEGEEPEVSAGPGTIYVETWFAEREGLV